MYYDIIITKHNDIIIKKHNIVLDRVSYRIFWCGGGGRSLWGTAAVCVGMGMYMQAIIGGLGACPPKKFFFFFRSQIASYAKTPYKFKFSGGGGGGGGGGIPGPPPLVKPCQWKM